MDGTRQERRSDKRKGPSANALEPFLLGAGDGLLSRVLSDGVPSAL